MDVVGDRFALPSGYSSQPLSNAGSDVGAEDKIQMLDDLVDEQVDAWDDQLHTIRPGLFLGSMRAEANLDALLAKGVTHILQVFWQIPSTTCLATQPLQCAVVMWHVVLQVGDGLRPSFPSRFTYKQVHVDDDEREDLVAHFQACFDFIEQAHASPGAGEALLLPCSYCLARCSRPFSWDAAPCVCSCAIPTPMLWFYLQPAGCQFEIEFHHVWVSPSCCGWPSLF